MKKMWKKFSIWFGLLALSLSGAAVSCVSCVAAMCYVRVTHNKRLEYVCLECGGKTLYSDQREYVFTHILQPCRKLVNEIQALGLDARLDERGLCNECRNKMELLPKSPSGLRLVVTHNNKTANNSVETGNLEALLEFLKNEPEWINGGGKDPESPSVRFLLGIWE